MKPNYSRWVHGTVNERKQASMWRKNWYERNVKRMTPQTIQRNFEDLHAIMRDTPDIPENKDQLEGLLAAIVILREHGAVDFKESE